MTNSEGNRATLAILYRPTYAGITIMAKPMSKKIKTEAVNVENVEQTEAVEPKRKSAKAVIASKKDRKTADPVPEEVTPEPKVSKRKKVTTPDPVPEEATPEPKPVRKGKKAKPSEDATPEVAAEEPEPKPKKVSKKKPTSEPVEEAEPFATEDKPKKRKKDKVTANLPTLTVHDPEGKRPLRSPKTERSPVDMPDDLTPESLTAWFERLIDRYVAKDIWITNAGLRVWRDWFTSTGWKEHSGEFLTLEEGRKVNQVLTHLIDTREEPAEYNPPKEPGKRRERSATPKVSPVKLKEWEVAGMKVATGRSEKGAKRQEFDGVSITSVLRWMGANDYSAKDGRAFCDALNLDTADSTIAAQISSGRKWGNERGRLGDVPQLSKEQATAIKKILKTSKKKDEEENE